MIAGRGVTINQGLTIKQGLSINQGLIINHENCMEGALVFTGPTFNTFLQIDRNWLFTYPLINFAGAYFNAITTAVTGLLIEFGMHEVFLPERVKSVR